MGGPRTSEAAAPLRVPLAQESPEGGSLFLFMVAAAQCEARGAGPAGGHGVLREEHGRIRRMSQGR
jgi:hypothetical protein